MHVDCHDHNHSHTHRQGRIEFAFFLNAIFCIVEFIGGAAFGSMAIVANAIHDLGDAVSLGIIWYSNKLSGKQEDENYPFGYSRFPIVAAFVSVCIILSGSIWIVVEAVGRLLHPHEQLNGTGMIIMASIGTVINSVAAWRLFRGKSHVEAVMFWHLLEDVAGWVIALFGALVFKIYGWKWIDSALAIGLAVLVSVQVIRRSRGIINVLLQRSPEKLDAKQIRQHINSVCGIDLKEIRVWSLDGEDCWLTAKGGFGPVPSITAKIELVRNELKTKFGIRAYCLEPIPDADKQFDTSR